MNAVLIALSIFISLVFAEIALRVLGVTYPNLYTVDPYAGKRLKPGAEGWFTEEGGSYVKINSDGFRDKEHTREKALNTVRIVVLGDSYTEALQVPQEKAFWSVMEQELNRCKAFPGKSVEVISLGVSGYGTAQQLQTLEHRAWSYKPDIVLLAFFTGNDIRNNSKELEPKWRNLRPFYQYQDGKLILDDSFKNTTAYKLQSSIVGRTYADLSSHLRTLQLLSKAFFRTLYLLSVAKNSILQHPEASPKVVGGALAIMEAGLDNNYEEPKIQAYKDAWAMTEGLIVKMRDEVRERGVNFFLVTLSNGHQVYPDAELRKSFAKELGINDLFYPDRRIEALAVKESIPHLILAPELAKYADKNKVFLHGFTNTKMGLGHWNENGHVLAGELISNNLCNVGWNR